MTDGDMLIMVLVAVGLLVIGWPRRGGDEANRSRLRRTPTGARRSPRPRRSAIPPYVRRYEGTLPEIAEQYLTDIGFTEPNEPRRSRR